MGGALRSRRQRHRGRCNRMLASCRPQTPALPFVPLVTENGHTLSSHLAQSQSQRPRTAPCRPLAVAALTWRAGVTAADVLCGTRGRRGVTPAAGIRPEMSGSSRGTPARLNQSSLSLQKTRSEASEGGLHPSSPAEQHGHVPGYRVAKADVFFRSRGGGEAGMQKERPRHGTAQLRPGRGQLIHCIWIVTVVTQITCGILQHEEEVPRRDTQVTKIEEEESFKKEGKQIKKLWEWSAEILESKSQFSIFFIITKGDIWPQLLTDWALESLFKIWNCGMPSIFSQRMEILFVFHDYVSSFVRRY
ncbi:Phosphatidate Phosphatase Lpin2 [Manis pentadactyla]|nr:Phosphatidate Phosphatase Lpin2 [Manis pentadactyla]